MEPCHIKPRLRLTIISQVLTLKHISLPATILQVTMANKRAPGEINFLDLPKSIFKIPNFESRSLSKVRRENTIDNFSAVKLSSILCECKIWPSQLKHLLFLASQKKTVPKAPAGYIKEEKELSFPQIGVSLTVKPSDIPIIEKLLPEMAVGLPRTVVDGIFKAQAGYLGMEKDVIRSAVAALIGKIPSVKKVMTPADKKHLPDFLGRMSDLESAAIEEDDDAADDEEDDTEGAEADLDDVVYDEEFEEAVGELGAEEGSEEEGDESSFNEDMMSLIPIISDTSSLGNWGQIERRPPAQIFFKLSNRSFYGYGLRPNGVRDYDESGKLVKGGVVGVNQPGFIKVTLNQDSKSALIKPFENVWHEGCSFQKKFLGIQIAARAHSQRVWDVRGGGQDLSGQLRRIGDWIQTELLREDGPVAAAISDLQATLRERDNAKKAAPLIRKKKIEDAEELVKNAAKKAKMGAKKY